MIISFKHEMEDPDEEADPQGVLSSLLPIREELEQGDLRSLYLGWVMAALDGALDHDDQEPPVPPNLGALSRAQKKLAEFLHIDREILAFAAKASLKVKGDDPDQSRQMAEWVAALPVGKKDKLLVQFMEGNDPRLGAKLAAQFRKSLRKSSPRQAQSSRRTVAEFYSVLESEWKKQDRS